MKRNSALVLLIIIVLLGVFAWQYRDSAWLAPLFGSNTTQSAQTQVGQANYICDADKTIGAVYYQGQTSSAATTDTPPAPNGSVALVLSDGRHITLPQTISGSGIRYANADGSVVFWTEGNTSYITEGANQAQTFSNCILTSNISGQESWKTFASRSLGYSVRYPDTYTLDTTFVNQEMGPGKNINGIKFTIPSSMATGTNLSADSYVSIEQLPNAKTCSASAFLSSQIGSSTMLTDNNVEYSFAKGSDAGAGNLYSEMVYAIPGSSKCTAIRYFIHSTQLANYPAGTITAFDQATLTAQFDGIRRSLVLAK